MQLENRRKSFNGLVASQGFHSAEHQVLDHEELEELIDIFEVLVPKLADCITNKNI